jgi:hypothetical protein
MLCRNAFEVVEALAEYYDVPSIERSDVLGIRRANCALVAAIQASLMTGHGTANLTADALALLTAPKDEPLPKGERTNALLDAYPEDAPPLLLTDVQAPLLAIAGCESANVKVVHTGRTFSLTLDLERAGVIGLEYVRLAGPTVPTDVRGPLHIDGGTAD